MERLEHKFETSTPNERPPPAASPVPTHHARVSTQRQAGLRGLPDLVRPMLAVPGELPPAYEDEQWAYELKWDGVRAIAYLHAGTVRLVSRNDLDVSVSYPEIL